MIRRMAGERVLIGDSIEVEIHEVKGREVQLAIYAPSTIRINRPSKEMDRVDRDYWATRNMEHPE
jgi:carbon storage regulator CsrA